MSYTTIDKPTDYFSTNLWVADDSSPRSFTGFGHQPDWVWTKHRGSGSTYHTVTDSVRGGNKQLSTPTNAAEDSGSHGIIDSFDSDGITVSNGTNATYPRLTFNELDPFGSGGGNYVCFSWKAGGSASSNTDGDVTSSVSANTTAGFNIVSFNGGGSGSDNIGHGLGSTPKIILIKDRDGATDWLWYTTAIDGSYDTLRLNTTGAKTDSSYTAPTSSVFYFPANTSNDYIAYCFAEKKGYSKFGSYTGNGNADGTFVYTGFRPAFLLVKKSSASGSDWNLHNNKSPGFNVNDNYFAPNEPAAEVTNNSYQIFDLLSNGFKCRGTGTGTNASGETFIYMAFAENPFVSSGGIPCTAR